MTLLDEINAAWDAADHEKMVKGWKDALEKNLDRVAKATKRFRESSPLDVYLSVSRAMAPTISFSLRFMGQEVAELIVEDDQPVSVKIGEKTKKSNVKYFDFDGSGKFDWQDTKGTALRKHFKDLDRTSVRVRVGEHRIESDFLHEMLRDDREKFSGTLAGIQPVTLAGCPFQFPLPISGNSGKPKASRGNIDILARRGTGRGTRLSIWELKAPGARAFPIEQAYIYAVTLIKVLRSSSGKFWYQDVMGFKGSLPGKLVVESVVAVSTDQKKTIEEKLSDFRSRAPLAVGQDEIRLCAAYYEQDPLRINFCG